jgi:chromate transporter
MLDEVVDRKGWLTREHFLHLVGITNLLPGPNSSEVAIHIGYTQRGWRGALATGLSFLAPTFLLVVFFSFLYFRFGSIPQVEGVFWGLKPAILAVILSAGWKLGRVAMAADGPPPPPGSGTISSPKATFQRSVLILLALGGMAAALLLERWEVAAMAAGGAIGWGLLRGRKGGGAPPSILGLALVPTSTSFLPPLVAPIGQLFGLTLGAGAVLFGGGYMLVALLEPFVVESYGWLTPGQFLDGIALTQAIPGPIVTLVAFVGFAVAGVPGAAVATAGIYIPSFVAVLLVAPWLERWRHLEGVGAALKGVNAVVAGAILGVGVGLIPPAIQDLWGSLILLVALVALVRFKAKAIWIVGGGIGIGLTHALISI